MQTEIEFIDNPQFREEAVDADFPTRLAEDAASPAAETSERDNTLRTGGTLTALCSAPLLTSTLEAELFRRMNLAKFRAHALRQRIDDARPKRELIDRAEWLVEEATRLRNRIVQSNLRLVVSIAKRFAGSRYTLDDLIDEGIFTLLRAVDKFDYDRGFRFSTYATRAIQRAMVRWVSRRKEEDERFRATPEEALSVWLGEGPSGAYSQARWEQLQSSLHAILAQLDDREQAIVQARFAMGDERQVQTLAKLAQRFGICKERVRQLEKRAIDKLRQLAQEIPLDEPGGRG
ncbi:MAG: sigma-70 family RNA polymerase sigma factor [Pirellulaceae bacterium]